MREEERPRRNALVISANPPNSLQNTLSLSIRPPLLLFAKIETGYFWGLSGKQAGAMVLSLTSYSSYLTKANFRERYGCLMKPGRKTVFVPNGLSLCHSMGPKITKTRN